MKKLLLAIGIILGLAWSCKTIYLPAETATTVNVIDSVAIHYLDSIRITEAVKFKDLAWLGDSLKIEGLHSRMWAVADTAKGAIIGGLEEDKVEEKTKYIYKDRWKVRDSLVYVEKPVPVEKRVEVKYVPWYHKTLSAVGLISILIVLSLLGIKIYKLRGKGIKEIIKTLL